MGGASGKQIDGELSEDAPAKVNLFLHVCGRRADGFHDLDSLVMFARPGDSLRLREDDTAHLSIDGPFAGGLAADETNLVLRAARAFAAAGCGRRTGAFHLTKNLPFEAGLGGGSSDAAAALRLLMRLNEKHGTGSIEPVALALGCDVPVCLEARATWMSGRGETLAAGPQTSPVDAVLVNPGARIATSDVFARLGLSAGTAVHGRTAATRPKAFATFAGLIDFLRGAANDLQAPAIAIAPLIRDCVDAVAASPGCALARMSGSGATVFGLYASPAEAQRAASDIKHRRPGWWVQPTRLS